MPFFQTLANPSKRLYRKTQYCRAYFFKKCFVLCVAPPNRAQSSRFVAQMYAGVLSTSLRGLVEICSAVAKLWPEGWSRNALFKTWFKPSNRLYSKTQYCRAYFFNILNFFSQKLGCKMRNLAGISRQSLLSLFGRLSCEFYWLPVAICELISLFLSYLASIDFILTMPCCTCFPLSKSFSAMMARAIESGRCSCSRQI